MNHAAETLAPGRAEGSVIALAEPLSFWGGFDSLTGRIIERRHPDFGRCLAGAILVMDSVRGSSSGSSTLAEAIRAGTAPAGIVLGARDGILTVGALVAAALYGRACPIIVVEGPVLADIKRSGRATIDATADSAHLRLS